MICATIVLLSLIGFFLRVIWKHLDREENPLDKLPGPPRYPIIGCAWAFIGISRRDLFQRARQFTKLYGDRYIVTLFKRRILYLNDVKDVEILLSHPRNTKKSKSYAFLETWLGTGLVFSSGAKWHGRRKILTPTFHFNILRDFLIVMNVNSKILVESLKKSEGTEVNLHPVISDFTLCTICETAMGTKLSTDKSLSTLEYKKAIIELANIIITRITTVWLHNEYLFQKLPISRKFEKCLQKGNSFTNSVIMEKKKNLNSRRSDSTEKDSLVGEKKRLVMIDLLLEAESKGEIDLEGIREEVSTFMAAGHETSGLTIMFALMLIADHEDVQDQIYEEIQHILGDSDRAPSMSDLADMKYLEAVIKETLRLYPSAPFIAREITEDFMLGDLPVKKGVEVAVLIYDIHRRADLFPDPEAFKPERFLSGKPMHPYAFIPFSAGPRNCIGQRFAMLEIKCVLSSICRNFKLSPRMKGARPELMVDMLIRPVDNIYVKFTTR